MSSIDIYKAAGRYLKRERVGLRITYRTGTYTLGEDDYQAVTQARKNSKGRYKVVITDYPMGLAKTIYTASLEEIPYHLLDYIQREPETLLFTGQPNPRYKAWTHNRYPHYTAWKRRKEKAFNGWIKKAIV